MLNSIRIPKPLFLNQIRAINCKSSALHNHTIQKEARFKIVDIVKYEARYVHSKTRRHLKAKLKSKLAPVPQLPFYLKLQ